VTSTPTPAVRSLAFELVDPDRHTTLLHGWFHQPHVLPWWGPARTMGEMRAYLAGQRDSGYLQPWIVSALDPGPDGEPFPFGYVETYRAAEDPLADVFPLTDRDRGWHVLVGPPEAIGRGLPRQMGHAILDRLFAEPGVERVVCEPDVRNERMHGFCRALGYEVAATLDLADKRAYLFAMDRATYDRRRA
jgi:RimJ/RimL family protein N-acetyltransferase